MNIVATAAGHNTSLGSILLPLFAIPILYFLCYSLYALYLHGIKNVTGNQKTQMSQAFLGFLICLVSLFISVIGDFYVNEGLWDVAFYVVLAIGIVFLGLGLGQSKNAGE